MSAEQYDNLLPLKDRETKSDLSTFNLSISIPERVKLTRCYNTQGGTLFNFDSFTSTPFQSFTYNFYDPDSSQGDTLEPQNHPHMDILGILGITQNLYFHTITREGYIS